MAFAILTYDSPFGACEFALSGGCRVTVGGQGDGFCYAHQSFDCDEKLSHEERYCPVYPSIRVLLDRIRRS